MKLGWEKSFKAFDPKKHFFISFVPSCGVLTCVTIPHVPSTHI